MIEYAKFLCKRILQRKSNIVLVLVSFLIVLIFLVMNIKTQDRFPEKLNAQIKLDMEQIDSDKARLAELPKDSEEYRFCEANIQGATSDMRIHKKIIMYVDNEDWSNVYEQYSKVLKERITILENSSNISGEGSTVPDNLNILKELTYIKYLQEHHLAYEDSEYPVSGLSFTTSMSQFILPILIAITCIYIVSQLFTLDYAKDIDISLLYPMNKKKVFFTKILVGAGISVLLYVLIFVFSFLIATLLTFNAGLEYPILLEQKSTGTWTVITTLSLCKEWFIVGILFFICQSLFAYIISLWIKEDIYLLLIILCVVLGLSYMPRLIGSLQTIAHVLPTTYMNYVNIANGSLANQYSNANISTSSGMTVLSIAILLQFLVCLSYHAVAKPIERLRK